jgi:hypothetical protein
VPEPAAVPLAGQTSPPSTSLAPPDDASALPFTGAIAPNASTQAFAFEATPQGLTAVDAQSQPQTEDLLLLMVLAATALPLLVLMALLATVLTRR